MNFRLIYRLIIFIILSVFCKSLTALNIDSLKTQFKKTAGIKKFDDLHDLIYEIRGISSDTAAILSEFYLEESLKAGNQKIISSANYSMGTMLYYKSEYEKAQVYLNKTLKYAEAVRDTLQKIETLNSLGLTTLALGKINKATDYFFNALKLCKQTTNDLTLLSSIYQNIAILYSSIMDNEKAIEYMKLAVECEEKMTDTTELHHTYLNLGGMYANNEDYINGEKYIIKAYEGAKSNGNITIQGTAANNLGLIYYFTGKTKLAADYFDKAIILKEKTGDKKGMLETLNGIGIFYMGEKEYAKAEKICRKALAEAEKINYILFNELICNCISESAYNLGNYKEAYIYLEKEIIARDTLINLDAKSALAEAEEKLKYEIKAAADSVQRLEEIKVEEAKLAESDAKFRQEQTQRYALSGGLILVIAFSIFIFNRLRVIRKQKNLIEQKEKETQEQKRKVEQQKDIVEEKNKEILDSITYAKRLQEAILPPVKVVKEYLPDSFILYKPKDIVAGDFYFMEPVGKKIIIAAADCTGHGVPGAMVSVVCANALNRTVKEFGIVSAEKILNKVRELVLETFSRSESEVKDGMDISLCVLDTKKNELTWSGANNPLWVVRAGSNEIEEFNPDKQPVGISYNPKPFTNHIVKLENRDSFYLFTDGYEDQFGGDKGKKFKTANMKKLILAVKNEDMEKQRELINHEFEKWKGKLEQLDDVCVIGIRI